MKPTWNSGTWSWKAPGPPPKRPRPGRRRPGNVKDEQKGGGGGGGGLLERPSRVLTPLSTALAATHALKADLDHKLQAAHAEAKVREEGRERLPLTSSARPGTVKHTQPTLSFSILIVPRRPGRDRCRGSRPPERCGSPRGGRPGGQPGGRGGAARVRRREEGVPRSLSLLPPPLSHQPRAFFSLPSTHRARNAAELALVQAAIARVKGGAGGGG